MLQLICGVPIRRGAGGVALGRQLACQVRQVLVHAVTAVCQTPRPQAVNKPGTGDATASMLQRFQFAGRDAREKIYRHLTAWADLCRFHSSSRCLGTLAMMNDGLA